MPKFDVDINKSKSRTMQITKEMTIADILETAPDSVEIMLEEGLHCVGCGANTMETLEEGMLSHGFTDDEIDQVVAKINETQAQKAHEEVKTPTKEDFICTEIIEGNKKYFRLAGLLLSQKAFDAIHQLADAKEGLAVRMEAGGCAGYTLKYDYQDTPQSDENCFELSEKISLFINDFTFDKLHGSIVDFESGLKGSGLKFTNPNSKSACSCGISVGF
jgi:iron-sulfur cluster assembly accessory protein